MQPSAPMLIAAGFDWIEGLLPVVFVLIWIVSQVMNLFRKAAGKPGDRQAGGPLKPPRPVARPPRPAADPQAGDVDREIQEFLARTLRGEQPNPPSPSARPTGARAGQREAARPSSPPSRPKPRPKVSESRPRSGGLVGLAGHGGDVADHVAAAFAHDLAHEAPSTLAADASGRQPAVADDLIAALRSPTDLRKLLMLRELLDRPIHRW